MYIIYIEPFNLSRNAKIHQNPFPIRKLRWRWVPLLPKLGAVTASLDHLTLRYQHWLCALHSNSRFHECRKFKEHIGKQNNIRFATSWSLPPSLASCTPAPPGPTLSNWDPSSTDGAIIRRHAISSHRYLVEVSWVRSAKVIWTPKLDVWMYLLDGFLPGDGWESANV